MTEETYHLEEVGMNMFIGWMLAAKDQGFDFGAIADSKDISDEAVQERYRLIEYLIEQRLTSRLEDDETPIDDLRIQVGIVLVMGLHQVVREFGSVFNFFAILDYTHND